MIQVTDLNGPTELAAVEQSLTQIIAQRLGYTNLKHVTGFTNE
jgi:hypothetical protein